MPVPSEKYLGMYAHHELYKQFYRTPYTIPLVV